VACKLVDVTLTKSEFGLVGSVFGSIFVTLVQFANFWTSNTLALD
jgi:hypothetical protein